MSARFTPAARTRTRRSPSRSSGSGTVESSIRPWSTTMARMFVVYLAAMAIRVLDDRRRELVFIRPPRRIVSLVPSDTLNVEALGFSVVGRTRYCDGDAPIVGGTKDLDGSADDGERAYVHERCAASRGRRERLRRSRAAVSARRGPRTGNTDASWHPGHSLSAHHIRGSRAAKASSDPASGRAASVFR